MVKKVIAIVLILATSGAWFYLDQLNKQAIREAEESRKAMEAARIQAKLRTEAASAAKAKFEAMLLADLNNCKAEAEKAKNDYLDQHKKPVRHKRGKFTVPQSVMDEATKTLEAADAVCQSTYDTRKAQGR
jgi:type II secretory pathway pseudopilin PulG